MVSDICTVYTDACQFMIDNGICLMDLILDDLPLDPDISALVNCFFTIIISYNLPLNTQSFNTLFGLVEEKEQIVFF